MKNGQKTYFAKEEIQMANNNAKRCLALLITEKCKSKLQLGTTSCQSEWPSLKSLQIINAEAYVEKRELSYTASGDASWRSHCGKQDGGPTEN